jgi:hypothetical protein
LTHADGIFLAIAHSSLSSMDWTNARVKMFSRKYCVQLVLPYTGSSVLKFFITSRPKSRIHDIFTGTLCKFHLAVNIEPAFDEVRRYLLAEFARIRRGHNGTLAMVPSPWPSPEITDNLVQKSSGYFLYTATIVKFVDERDFGPMERLNLLIGGTHCRHNN